MAGGAKRKMSQGHRRRHFQKHSEEGWPSTEGCSSCQRPLNKV